MYNGMVSVTVFDYLISQKTKDANVLLKNERHVSAIYLMGYALEYSLKKKICSTLLFTNGFPEQKNELLNYIKALNRNPLTRNVISFTDIREIRNHNLNKLLNYSGAEARVKLYCANDWSCVAHWNPEDRYKRQRVSKVKAIRFISSARAVMNQIF